MIIAKTLSKTFYEKDGATISIRQNNIPDHVSQTGDLPGEIHDVMIVVGRITGIITAPLLQEGGKKCIIAKVKTIGFETLGDTTAHLDTFMDSPYSEIAKNLGKIMPV